MALCAGCCRWRCSPLWMLFWVDPEWFIGITIGLAPLGGIGLILTRKMVPNWRPREADVLDEVLIQSTTTSKHS